MHRVFVAINTSRLSHSAIAIFDLDRFTEILEGESQRVKEPVVCFCHPFPYKVVR